MSKRKLYKFLLTIFFVLQFASFSLVQFLIFQIYLFDIYTNPYWGYGVFVIAFFNLINFLFSYILEFTIQPNKMKSKIIFIGCFLPFLIWFNYESVFWALICGSNSLVITLIWYGFLFSGYKNRMKS